jgi:ubiquitin-conjugating enzyme E2 J2
MSSALYITRLRKELRELKKNPVNNIQALPKESNILEWHYVIEGPKGSPYEGGW